MADSSKGTSVKNLTAAPAVVSKPAIVGSNGVKQKLVVVTERVPVRFAWTPGTADSPTVQPLTNIGKPGDHIASITLHKTHSNAPASLTVSALGVEPTEVGAKPHELAVKKTTNGDPIAFVVPPGTDSHEVKIYENPNPPRFDKSSDKPAEEPIKIDYEKLKTDGVTDHGESVFVAQESSEQLYPLLRDNLRNLAGAAKQIEKLGGKKEIEIKKEHLDKFIDSIKTKIESTTPTPKTDPIEHQLVLKAWTDNDHFGREVADSAVHGDHRNQLLAPDTRHEVIADLSYELVRQVPVTSK